MSDNLAAAVITAIVFITIGLWWAMIFWIGKLIRKAAKERGRK